MGVGAVQRVLIHRCRTLAKQNFASDRSHLAGQDKVQTKTFSGEFLHFGDLNMHLLTVWLRGYMVQPQLR